MDLPVRDIVIDDTTHAIVDGMSARQYNGFDCGVFAMANVERYGLEENIPISQNTMKLYRCRYLGQLYELGIAMGVTEN